MARLRTHYDNLKVARDAPIEVIRAAYKTLSQKYHPDHQPGDERAARIMAIINRSYEALSDPVKRSEHDRWIREAEAEAQEKPKRRAPGWEYTTFDESQAPPPKSYNQPQVPNQPPVATPQPERKSWLAAVALLALMGLMAWLRFVASSPEPKNANSAPASVPAHAPAPAPITTTVPPLLVFHTRPALTPKGSPWPTVTSYLPDEPILNDYGESSITIDNSRRSLDTHVKLYEGKAVVRQFLLKAHDSFMMSNLPIGTYLIHYQDLDSGDTWESEPIILSPNYRHEVSLTLYTVPKGNTRNRSIDPKDF
jgi:hypothetical protein